MWISLLKTICYLTSVISSQFCVTCYTTSMKPQYCQRCSSKFTDKGQFMLCTLCGYKFYFNPRPTNTAILFDKEGKILLLRRKFDPHKGKLDLPGGFMEYNESAEESMQRELMEEVGFEADDLSYVGSFPDIYNFQEEDIHVIGIVFRGRIPSYVNVEKITSNEASEIVLLSIEEIRKEDLGFESMSKALQKVSSVY